MKREFWRGVEVGGNQIDVFLVEDLRADDGELLDGEWRPRENVILINKGLSGRRRLVTLVHEAFHAAELEFHIDVKHQAIHTLSSIAVQVLAQFFEVFHESHRRNTKRKRGSPADPG